MAPPRLQPYLAADGNGMCVRIHGLPICVGHCQGQDLEEEVRHREKSM
jgi:hypothetical protein